jgi:hypothetical protein
MRFIGHPGVEGAEKSLTVDEAVLKREQAEE